MIKLKSKIVMIVKRFTISRLNMFGIPVTWKFSFFSLSFLTTRQMRTVKQNGIARKKNDSGMSFSVAVYYAARASLGSLFFLYSKRIIVKKEYDR